MFRSRTFESRVVLHANIYLFRLVEYYSTRQIRDTSFICFTEEVNKVALSAEDDKRVIMEDGIHTLAYGHYRLKN